MDSDFALDAPALIKVCGVELDRRSENIVLVTAMCFSDRSTKCRVLDVKPSTQSGLEKAGKQAGRIALESEAKAFSACLWAWQVIVSNVQATVQDG